MKKYFTIICSIVIFTAFSVFITIKKQTTPVIKIISPDILQIDFNHNRRAENTETICIPNVEVPSLDFKKGQPKFLKAYNETDAIKLAYLANEFAKETLYLKNVKLKYTKDKTHNCKYAEVLVDGKFYSDLLVENGFASKFGQFNNENLKENMAKQADLVIFNLKSNKYHTLNCEYGQISSDHTIIQKSQLPKDAKPCQYCHIKKPIKEQPKIKSYKSIASDGNIKMIITDFTTILKPNKNCNHEVCKMIEQEVNNAKESIDIACYSWSNIPNIVSAIKNAYKRGVRIRIVYDATTRPYKDYIDEIKNILNLSRESKSDFKEGQIAFTDRLMHNKFMIFDSKIVTTGSMNYTNTGLSGFNSNIIFLINSKDIAKLYEAEFEQMLSGKFHNEKTSTKLSNQFIIGNTRISVYFSPYDKGSKHIIPLIDNAKKYIYAPIYLITHDSISKALIRAKQRGVDVKVIIDATNTSANHTKHSELRKNNIPVKTETFAGKLHSKSMIIDDKYIIAGSMNFSNSGENWNDENLLIIENSNFAQIYKDFFNYLWTKIDDKWLRLNARSESSDSIGSCFDGIDNDYDGKIDMEDFGCNGITN